MKRICQECGAEYSHDSKQKFCSARISLGTCEGVILPKPTEEKNGKSDTRK